jgi:release factor glutamine methyltransferase
LSSSIRQRLAADAEQLAAALELEPAGARIEVQSLLQHVLRQSRAWMLAHAEQALTAIQQAEYQGLLQRRLQGEPIAYLLGEREFYGLLLKVTPATLIPRPETELLVELALERMPQHQPCRVLDLGAGSGAIALAIAQARPAAMVTAADAAPAALEVARQNAQRLAIHNVRFVRSNWFAALAGEDFDLIVSNPPYVAADDPHLQQGDLRFEPLSALASGADGLDDIRRIVGATPAHLRDEGWLLLEHGYDQAAKVRELLTQAGFQRVFSAPDLAGIERVSGGRRA